MSNVFLSSAYLPPIQYFSKLLLGKRVFIEKYENYLKQTYRNRCSILSANGALSLSIPIESAGGNKLLITDVRISEHGNWRHLHWNALVSAYNSTPFFEYYADELRLFYEKKYEFLFDFNQDLFYLILEFIGIDASKVFYTDCFVENIDVSDYDFRYSLTPKNKKRYDDPYFEVVAYYQTFDHKFAFTPDLSIVDLLFNMGNESILVLEKSIKKTF